MWFAVSLVLCASTEAAIRSEEELLKIAGDSRAGVVERTRAFADLQTVATERAIPALAAALRDPVMRVPARSVLEALPAPAAEQALLSALESAGDDAVCAGLIQSLGQRRSSAAVPAITRFLRGRESAAAGAAMDALGNIGTPEAADALAKYEAPAAMRIGWGDALLRAAENLLASNRSRALELYGLVSTKGDAPQRAAASVRLARLSTKPVPSVADALRADQPAIRLAALAAIRTGEVGPGLLDEIARVMASLPGDLQAQVLSVLYDRGDREAAAIARRSLSISDPAVQSAAAKLLSLIGTPADAPALLALMERTEEPGPASRLALTRITGDEVTAALVQRFREGGASRAPALEVLVGRGHRKLLDDLLQPELHADDAMRSVAANAILTLGTGDDLGRVLELHRALPTEQRGPLETALRRLVAKHSGPDEAAALVMAAIEKLPVAEAVPLVAAFGGIAVEPAIASLARLLASPSPELRKAALDTLGGIRDIRAADTLLRTARAEPDPATRALAIRLAAPVYARSAQGEGSAPVPGALPAAIAGLRATWNLAERPTEQKVVLNALRGLKHPQAIAAADELEKAAKAAGPK